MTRNAKILKANDERPGTPTVVMCRAAVHGRRRLLLRVPLKTPHSVVLTMTAKGSSEEQGRWQCFTGRDVYVLGIVVLYDPGISKTYGTVSEVGLFGYEELVNELDSMMEIFTEYAEKRR